MTIGRVLVIVGWLLIAGGLIGGITSFAGIDSEQYKLAEEVADDLYDNEFAQAEYRALKSAYQTELALAWGVLFSGIIGGLFCLGFARIIELLETKGVQ